MNENQLPVLSMPVDIDMDVDKANLLLRLYAAAAAFRGHANFGDGSAGGSGAGGGNPPVSPPPLGNPAPSGVPNGGFNPDAASGMSGKGFGAIVSAPFVLLGAATNSLIGSFSKLGKALSSTISVLGRVFSTAMKWTLGITALSAGSLFGYDKLAQHVSSTFNASRAMNITAGFGNAVRNVWGNKLDDSQGLLSAIAGAQGRPDDPAYAGLRALHLNPEDDVRTNYEAALISAHNFARSNQGPAARSRFNTLYGRIGLGPESYNQLRAMGEPEFTSAQKELARQSVGTNLSESTQQSYQQTLIHLQGNIDSLGSHFVKVLEVINPALMKFSDAFTNNLIKFMDGNGKALFSSIADGLDKFAKYLNSPEFLSDMQSLASGISALSKTIVSALQILGVIPQGGSGMDQVAPGEAQGPKYPPRPDKDWSPMDWVGGLYSDPNRLVAIQKKDAIFKAAAAKNSISENLIKSIAKEESGGVSSAVSSANAMGVMQLTRATGIAAGLSTNNDFADFFDPVKNINAGASILSRNLAENRGDLAKALAQYNGGNYVFREGGDLKKPRDADNLYLKKETVEYLLKIIRDNNPEIERQHPGITKRLQDADSMFHRKGNENNRVRIELSTKQAPGSDTQASVSSVRGQAALFMYQNQTVRGTA